MSKLNLILLILLFSVAAFAQTEILNNSQIIEMSKVGLIQEVILKKIENSQSKFDVSTNALVELKKSGVGDEVISAMIDKASSSEIYRAGYSESVSSSVSRPTTATTTTNTSPVAIKNQTPAEALKSAKTIALIKSSLHPSRQALEKELLKRADFQALNLSLERYKETADLYVEIGYVHMSLITHRYVFRVYDRRSGAVLAAGETTSWGSLAENLARNISKSLAKIAWGK
jgi:hypothetical protein